MHNSMAIRKPGKRKPAACHTSVWPGKRVLIRLRNGELFVDVFVRRGRAHVELKNRGRLPIVELSSMSIYKGE